MSTVRRTLSCWLVIAFVVVAGLNAVTDEVASKTLSPYFLVQNGDDGESETPLAERFPLRDTDVRVSICGVIADVTVTQHYQNTGTVPINAQYVFPASTRAAVHGMKMKVGQYMIIAKVKERKQAKQEFEKAKKAGKSASLLEQERPNVFTMNVANIMPGDDVGIELKYTELLVPTDGVYEFVYPTVVGPRYSRIQKEAAAPTDQFVEAPYTKEGVKPKHEFNIKLDLSTGVPLRNLDCTTHKVEVTRGADRKAEVFLCEDEKYSADRDFILKYSLQGKKIQSGVIFYEGEKENYFVVMTQPPERVELSDVPPREYIFVIDVSGSMSGFPLNTAKELLKNLIGNLKETDKFNVILFAGVSRILSEKSLPATPENIKTAIDVISQQRGGGGTELSGALRKALAFPKDEGVSRSILVITDGYIAVEKEVFDLIRNNLNKANVFAFGIGSGVNRYLIEGIGRVGMGEPFVVTEPRYASETAANFRKYIENPVLTGISVDFEGVDVYDVEPRQIPDMFAQRPIVIMGKWRGHLDGSVYVKGRMVDGAYEEEIPLNKLSGCGSNRALRYLWARTRIARLSDYNLDNSEEVRREIVSLGLTYNLLTKYTSFIAVLEEIRNPDGSAKDIKQPLPLPKGVSNMAVGRKVPEPGFWLMVALAIVMMLMITRRKVFTPQPLMD